MGKKKEDMWKSVKVKQEKIPKVASHKPFDFSVPVSKPRKTVFPKINFTKI